MLTFNLNGRFVDAEQAKLACNDSAVLFGDSLFETLKAQDGHIQFLDQHLDRLELAARLLSFPCDRSTLRRALLETVERLATPLARLRLTLSRGPMTGLTLPSPESGHFFISAAPYQEPESNERQQGVVCVFAPNRRVNPLSHLPQLKRGNYADCLYAADYARRKGAREALFQTDDGQLLEGATSNLFIVKDDILFTPPAGELVLAGIIRRQVLLAAQDLGLSFEERSLSVADLFAADEAFLTNSLFSLLPIAQIEGRHLSHGPWTARLATAVAQAATAISAAENHTSRKKS
jgi:branched-chain amino acid aminotransferase